MTMIPLYRAALHRKNLSLTACAALGCLAVGLADYASITAALGRSRRGEVARALAGLVRAGLVGTDGEERFTLTTAGEELVRE